MKLQAVDMLDEMVSDNSFRYFRSLQSSMKITEIESDIEAEKAVILKKQESLLESPKFYMKNS